MGEGMSVELDTGQTGYLPCRFATSWLSDIQRLGNDSFFSGNIALRVYPSKLVDANVRGMIGQVQLHELFKTDGHFAKGLCNVNNLDCHFVQSRIKKISGNINSDGGGYVGSSLLLGARRYLGIGSYDQFENKYVAYRDFGFD